MPRELVTDNLKAAVLQAALDDTVLSDPYRRMAQHYGCLIHPCRPASPQQKGKVESGVHYVQRNFWAGQEFLGLEDANRRGGRWVREVAGVRDHGTTHAAPLARFHRDEVAALLPLRSEPFSLLSVRTARVHRDCHVTVEGSYYSAPHLHVGASVEVHLTEGTVQIYDGLTLLVTHPRASGRGQRRTRLEHYPAEKAIYLERTPEVCRDRAARVGPSCQAAVDALLAERPLDQLRAVQKLVGLEEKVGRERLEAACLRALHYGDPRYTRVKSILAAGMENDPLSPNELPANEPSKNERLPETPSIGSPLGEDGPGEPVASSPRSYLHARGIQEFFPKEFFPADLFEPQRPAPDLAREGSPRC